MRAVRAVLGSDEHWRKNGKWVDDKRLISWAENGCKRAETVEEFLSVNPNMTDIHYVESQENKEELDLAMVDD